jgi:hypothetical protein
MKGSPQRSPLLFGYRQLAGQILDRLLCLHKIYVSFPPNQPSKGKILFGSSSYLLSPVVVVENRNLHFLDVIQELLFIPSESWSKQQVKAKYKAER